MENRLRIAGKVFTVIYAVAAVCLMVMLVFYTTSIRGFAATPRQVGVLLNEADFRDQLAPALFSALVAQLPETLTANNTVLRISELTRPLLAADARTIATTILSPEWLQAQFSGLISNTISRAQLRASEQSQLFLGQFEGQPAFEIAQVVLQLARVCSAQEEQVLGSAAVSGDYSLINFICNPTNIPEGTIRNVMRDVIITFLGQLGAQLVAEIEIVLPDFDLSEVVFDTPVGPVRIEWPYLVIGQGILSFRVAIPEELTTRVEAAIARADAAIQTAVALPQQMVATSSANIQSLATEAVGLARTLTAPTDTPTPMPTDTPIPIAMPEIRPLDAAADAAQAMILEVDAVLMQAADWIVIRLLVVGVVVLIHLLFCVLFALRRWRPVGLWAGVVLAASGLFVLIRGTSWISDVIFIDAAPPNAPTAVLELQATIERSLEGALYSEIITPLQTQGIILLVLGVALLAIFGFLSWQAAKKSPKK